MNARAIVFDKEKSAKLSEISLPDLTENDVLVKTELSAISVGTERWTYLGLRGEIGWPNVPGYMGAGRIVEVGSKAAEQGYEKGRLLYFGRSELAGDVAGKSWMATHLSKAVVNVINPLSNQEFFSCTQAPKGVEAMDISLAALCGVAMRGIEMAGVPAGVKVLVVGLGVLGQYAAQICRLKGALVAVADISPSRIKIAEELGAEWCINSAIQDLPAEAAKIAPNGFDIIIDTSSIDKVVNSLWPLLKVHGKFIFQGWYPPLSQLDLNAAHVRMPQAFFPCGYSHSSIDTALRWMRDGRINTRKLVTHVEKPENAESVYRMIDENTEDFLGVVFDWKNI